MKFKIKIVSKKILRDYDGMNFEASKAMGFPYPYSKNTILIRSDLTPKDKKITFKHEIDEFNKMNKGIKYWKAHQHALKNENK